MLNRGRSPYVKLRLHAAEYVWVLKWLIPNNGLYILWAGRGRLKRSHPLGSTSVQLYELSREVNFNFDYVICVVTPA